MQDDEKMALHDMLLVTADRAEECGFSGLADQMCVWAAQIGSRIAGWSMALSHPVTPNDVANAVNMPVFLPGCGPRSGRTSRMLCEAVAAAMNGLTVIVSGRDSHESERLAQQARLLFEDPLVQALRPGSWRPPMPAATGRIKWSR